MPKKFFSHSRLTKLAEAREISPYFVPDKVSIYWLDYIYDDTPQTITDPYELLNYYRNCRKSYPRIEKLAQARTWPYLDFDARPKTAFGIPVCALRYIPSERIKKLATPILREEDSQVPARILPPVVSKSRTPTYYDKSNWLNQAPDMFSRGDFQARSRMHRNDYQNAVANIPTNENQHDYDRNPRREYPKPKHEQILFRDFRGPSPPRRKGYD